jgi:hypothetical protein
MPKIGKNHLIKKTKLVKTTTFFTLLIAATFLFSSFAPATMITKEMNENNVEPLTIGDNNLGDVPQTELISGYNLPKTHYTDNGLRADIVWDNGMHTDNYYASQYDTSFPFEAYMADDFIFIDDTNVGSVQFKVDNLGNHPNCIEFYEDDGGLPGDLYAGPFCLEAPDYESIVDIFVAYEYVAPIPPTLFTGGEKYWVCIYGNFDVFPQSFVGAHYDILESEGAWKCEYFGVPDWTLSGDYFTNPWDMAFILYGIPDHDVTVSAINSPYDNQELCECLPVSIDVANLGANDEVNVPVTVEIRKPLLDDSFEDPLNVVWKRDCWKWSLEMTDTGNPSVVTPRTDSYMAQFKGGQGADLDCMLYEADYEDFSEVCVPTMSFYMWHDTFGSEDYLEVWVDPGTGVFEFVDGPFTRLCCPGCPTGWKEHIVDLSAYAGLTHVRVGFMGYSDGNLGAYNLHIDDVSKYDLEYYAETTVDIAFGETITIDFPDDWCPCGWGMLYNQYRDFDILACTHLDIDEVQSNDCIDDVITVYFPFEEDVAAIDFIEPPEEDPGPYTMCGIIKNVGQVDMSCFKAKLRVFETGALSEIFREEFNDICFPPGIWPPAMWTINTHGSPAGNWQPQCGPAWWSPDDTGSASGYPNAMFYYWPGFVISPWVQFITPPIDTSTYGSWVLEFDHYLSNWAGGYDVGVEVSTDLMSWQTLQIWPAGNIQPEHVTIESDYGAGGVIYIAFSFFGGDPFDLNAWGIDDVIVSGKGLGDMIYYDEVCVEDLAVCQELEVCFKDFTPPTPWPDCDSVDYLVSLEVNPCDPLDDNPDNNIHNETLTVEFYRDIIVSSIVGPCPAVSKGDVIFSQEPDTWTNAYTSDAQFPHIVADDFFGVTDAIGGLTWWGLSLFFTGYGWLDATPEDMVFEVKIYDDASGSPGTEIWSDTYGESDVARSFYGMLGGWATIYEWTVEIDPCVIKDTGWLSIQVLSDPDGDSFLWLNTINGNSNAHQNGYSIGDNVAFNLTECEATGAPPVSCFIPCGEADIIAVIENAGTHNEIVDIFMELQEFITDPMVGTTVMTGVLNNVAIASGDTYEANFGSYNFVDSGVYALIISAPLAGDCDPDNNEMLIGIGVDCCPPVSMHYPDPLYPNGENNWYTRSVDVEITATDPLCPDPCLGTSSGVKEIHYIIDGGDEVIVPGATADFKLTTDGVHLVEYWAVDNAGNVEDPFTFEIAIDKTAPTVTLLYNVYQDEAGAWHVDFTAALNEATSGDNRVEFYIGAGLEKTDTEGPYEWSIDWIDDYKTVTFKAVGYDNAGNDGEDTVPGSEIAEEITAHAHAHQYIKSKTLSVLHKQLPRSR